MMNHDFEDAVKMALEPETQQGQFELCTYCGAIKHSLSNHVCRSSPLEFAGGERDERRRAKSYAIE